MTRRIVGLVLLVAALGIHVGLTLPARRSRDAARELYARQREERERLRAEVARLERRSSAAAGAQAPAGEAAAARALRLSLLSATRGIAVGNVEIAAQGERRGAVAARGRLSAAGSQADLLRAAGRLAEPDAGLRLDRMQLSAGTGTPRLEAETVLLRASS
jgi:hypothetical protein